MGWVTSSSCAQDPSWQSVPHATAPRAAGPALPRSTCPLLCGCTCSSPCPSLPDSACRCLTWEIPHPLNQLLANCLPFCPGGRLVLSPAPVPLLPTAAHLGEDEEDDAASVTSALRALKPALQFHHAAAPTPAPNSTWWIPRLSHGTQVGGIVTPCIRLGHAPLHTFPSPLAPFKTPSAGVPWGRWSRDLPPVLCSLGWRGWRPACQTQSCQWQRGPCASQSLHGAFAVQHSPALT